MALPLAIIALHLTGSQIAVLLLIDRIVPATKLMEDVTTKSLLELVQSVHGMRRVGIGCNAEHVIFQTFACLGNLVFAGRMLLFAFIKL